MFSFLSLFMISLFLLYVFIHLLFVLSVFMYCLMLYCLMYSILSFTSICVFIEYCLPVCMTFYMSAQRGEHYGRCNTSTPVATHDKVFGI